MKAGASNNDKNRIRKLHSEGKSIAQISALTSVQPKHVQAIVSRLNETGKLIYTTGKAGVGGKMDYLPGGVEGGGDENISEREAIGRIQAENDQKVAELERQLAEARAGDLPAEEPPAEEPPAEEPPAEEPPAEEPPADEDEEEENTPRARRRRRSAG